MKHKVWERWVLVFKDTDDGCLFQHVLAYSDPGKLRVITWLPLKTSVPTDDELIQPFSKLRNFFLLKLINSSKYLFISISILRALLIRISISEFDRNSAKLEFSGLQNKSLTLMLDEFTKATLSFSIFFEARWLVIHSMYLKGNLSL